jgi:REP element-mobilizing transposase RayT
LDAGAGFCALRDSVKRQVVVEALRHFDGTRYELDAFVVMPNHVHVLVTPTEGGAKPFVSNSLPKILHSWKSFTAHRMVQEHGLAAPFWMDENFDHLVRSEAQWRHFRNYIRENPRKGRLRVGEFTWWERHETEG